MSTKTALKTDARLTQCSALALATGLLLAANPAHAQSFEGVGAVVEGAATINTAPNTTDITVESESAVIDWTPTDANGTGDILFQQAGTTATFINGAGIVDYAVLNRILPNDPSRRIVFDGNVISRIQDNLGNMAPGGTVFFYSPGGILIGSNAVFDVGSLGLTTAAPVTDGNGNFIVNDTVTFQEADQASPIDIFAGAQINALSESSYVAVFAPRISNAGDIRVNGQVALVAGASGTITFSPDGLFDIQVDIGTDAGSIALQNDGSITGPASTGAGDNHRIYMVAIPRNNAVTMSILGGSELGFDIAQSASMDGEAIVLSAGYNITVGDIEMQSASTADASISFQDVDIGSGQDLFITSDVIARAATFAGMRFGSGGNATFLGDLELRASSASALIGDFGSGPSSLIVEGDLTFVGDTPFFGNDGGNASLTVENSASIRVGGDMTIRSQTFSDTDGNGEATTGLARLFVRSGAFVDVGGNLEIGTIADLSEGEAGVNVRARFSELFMDGDGTANVAGATRIANFARGGAGGGATSEFASLFLAGGALTTGELTVSSDAFGGNGLPGGFGAGFADSQGAAITLDGPTTSLMVLRSNTTLDTDFISAEAFGGSGVEGDGGSANSSGPGLFVRNGATLDLPNDPANPLLMINAAIGGDTSEDDGAGGFASSGQTTIDFADSTSNLGNLLIVSDTRGGSANTLGGAERTRGGDAFSDGLTIRFFNSDIEASFADIILDVIGGDGSRDIGGDGGQAFGNNVTVFVDNSFLDVGSELFVSALARGGDGHIGGNARGFNTRYEMFNGVTNVAGGFGFESMAEGGFGFDLFDDGGARGGDASFDTFLGMTLNDSSLTTPVGILMTQSAIGGDAANTQGGNANTLVNEINFQGISSISAPFIDVDSFARGGSIEAGGFGNGGAAFSQGAGYVSTFDGTGELIDVTIAAETRTSSEAIGGAAGTAGGDGGEANAGFARIALFEPSEMTIIGDFSASISAVGGDAPAGLGGATFTGEAEIFSSGTEASSVTVDGDVLLNVMSRGGDGQTGGDASAFAPRILASGTDITVTGAARLNSTVIGGDALASDNPGRGGDAIGSSPLIRHFVGPDEGLRVFTFGEVEMSSTATGGRGGDATNGADGGAGGDAFGGFMAIFGLALRGGLVVEGATTLSNIVTGGDGGIGTNGGSGGNAIEGAIQFGTISGGEVPDAVTGFADLPQVDLTLVQTGGNGGAATDGIGGDGGFARFGFGGILVRGAPLTSDAVTFSGIATGGDGGDGSVQGNGGYASAPSFNLTLTQSFMNPGRGSSEIGTITATTQAIGGLGATNGTSYYTNNDIFIRQSDIAIEMIDFDFGGDAAPDFQTGEDENGAPIFIEPFPNFVILENATLTLDTLSIQTPADMAFSFDADSLLTSRIFDIAARGFILPDPENSAFNNGEISVEERLTLVATDGDIAIEPMLSGNAQVALDAAGSIVSGDISAPLITLAALGDIVFTSVFADDFAANAGGGIISNGEIDVAGNAQLFASGDVNVADVFAGVLGVTSTEGAIIGNGLIDVAGLADLNANGEISLGDVVAGTLRVRSNDGLFASNGAIFAEDEVDIDAGEGVILGDIEAGSLVVNTGGAVDWSQDINVGGNVLVTAAGDIGGPAIVDAGGDITLISNTGTIGAEFLTALAGTITLEAPEIADMPGLAARNLIARTSQGNLRALFPLAVEESVLLESAAGIEIGDIEAASITINAVNSSSVGDLDANDIAISVSAGGLDSGFLDASDGTLTLEIFDDILLGSLAAGSLDARSTNGSILGEGLLTIDGSASFEAARTVSLGDVNAGSIAITAVDAADVEQLTAANIEVRVSDGGFTSGFLDAGAGTLLLETLDTLVLGDLAAGTLIARSTGGDVVSMNPLSIANEASFDAARNVLLGDLDAGSIAAASGALTSVGGIWSAETVSIQAANFAVDPGASINAGSIAIVSNNEAGTLVGDLGGTEFDGNAISADIFARLNAPQIDILHASIDANGNSVLTIGEIDIAASGSAQNVNFGATGFDGEVLVNGLVSASAGNGPVNLTLTGATIRIDTVNGGIDLFDNGGLLSLIANRVLIGEAGLFDALTGEETEEELAALADLINSPAANIRPEGTVRAAEIAIEAGQFVLIQNSGTAETPAGFVIANADNLSLDPFEGSSPLVIINGQIDDGSGTVLVGDEAATAIGDLADNLALFNASSQLNGCAVSGCIVEDDGEVTATVSAAVNGAVNTTGSNTGTGSAGSGSGSGSNNNSGGSGDGSDSGSDSGGSAGAGSGTGAASSEGGSEPTVDDVDDGGGDDEFVVEEEDSASDEGEAESESEESEEGEESEEESEEEESSEEEEEEAEAAATGPIAPPVTIFNTNALDRPVTINDPISGSGNPALTDPDIDTPPAGGSGDPQ